MNYQCAVSFKNYEGQEGKINLFQECIPVEAGKHKETEVENVYGGHVLYPYMIIKE
jgi:hypothetical protein